MHRIDRRLPLLWRTPTDVQVGFAVPVVILSDLSPAHEYLLSALHSGVSDVSLRALGAQRGLSDADVTAFLHRLEPCLEKALPTLTAIAIDGTGLGAARLSHVFTEHGFDVVPAHELAQPKPGTARNPVGPIALVVATMAMPAARCGLWLRRDIPHIPVLWLDTEVRIGPLITPGQTACWHCMELARCEQDPAYQAMVTQVAGKPAASETLRLATEVGVRLSRWLDGSDAPPAGTALKLCVATGRWHPTQTTPHEACSCHTPRGNAMPDERVDAPFPTQPTRGAGVRTPA